ncbi:hypothetical protein NUSPORA_00991 [Nucleospora cyclopteri]
MNLNIAIKKSKYIVRIIHDKNKCLKYFPSIFVLTEQKFEIYSYAYGFNIVSLILNESFGY